MMVKTPFVWGEEQSVESYMEKLRTAGYLLALVEYYGEEEVCLFGKASSVNDAGEDFEDWLFDKLWDLDDLQSVREGKYWHVDSIFVTTYDLEGDAQLKITPLTLKEAEDVLRRGDSNTV